MTLGLVASYTSRMTKTEAMDLIRSALSTRPMTRRQLANLIPDGITVDFDSAMRILSGNGEMTRVEGGYVR